MKARNTEVQTMLEESDAAVAAGNGAATLIGGESGFPKSDGVVVRIEASRGWAPLNFRELWAYRELLYFFVWRDIKVHYKQTALGAAWAIIQPVFTMVVFTVFFGRFAKMPSDGIPYPIFSLAALVPWTCFSNGLTHSSNSLVGQSNMVKKVYFPRVTLPFAAVLVGVVDFIIAMLVLVVMMYFYGRIPTGNIVWIPAFLLLSLVTSLGMGLWFSAMNVQFRDIRYLVPFLLQLWMFASPIAYSAKIVPVRWQHLYALNPMVGVVEGFRWALFGTSAPPDFRIALSALVALAILVSGAYYFRRMERTFADVV